MSCYTHWKSTLSTVDPPPGRVGERRRDRQEESLIEKRVAEWRHLHKAYKKEFTTIAGFSHHDSNPTPEPCSGGSGYKNPLPHTTAYPKFSFAFFASGSRNQPRFYDQQSAFHEIQKTNQNINCALRIEHKTLCHTVQTTGRKVFLSYPQIGPGCTLP